MKRMSIPIDCMLLTHMPLAAYEIRLGTIEQIEADKEWVLSTYSRTAKKRNLLTGPAPRPGRATQEDSEEPKSKKARR